MFVNDAPSAKGDHRMAATVLCHRNLMAQLPTNQHRCLRLNMVVNDAPSAEGDQSMATTALRHSNLMAQGYSRNRMVARIQLDDKKAPEPSGIKTIRVKSFGIENANTSPLNSGVAIHGAARMRGWAQDKICADLRRKVGAIWRHGNCSQESNPWGHSLSQGALEKRVFGKRRKHHESREEGGRHLPAEIESVGFNIDASVDLLSTNSFIIQGVSKLLTF
ncbi:hypothetical protein DFH09DRAFT_1079152 [Mycena vulgaris]|nr:hypothetical protein DFH09DRAFT_1079152 [Mycena vulgaris]